MSQLGVKSWARLAQDAGVRDTSSFGACMGNPTATSLVDSGRALSGRLQLRGTPTIVVNGWKTKGPSLPEVERVLSAFRDGKTPDR